jgi:hypothetical protein
MAHALSRRKTSKVQQAVSVSRRHAIRVNKQNAASQQRVAFRAQLDPDGDIRTETFQGRKHLVVPVIALVEGVLQGINAEEPELALSEEFGRHVDGWNGRPVVLNHPLDDDGEPTSANSPTALEAYGFGILFNSKVVGKKLKTEAWIDIQAAKDRGGEFEDMVSTLKKGDMVEVSTGLYTTLEEKTGRFNGKAYGGIWRSIVPDHLAILSGEKIGACSIADGCGTPRTNAKNAKDAENTEEAVQIRTNRAKIAENMQNWGQFRALSACSCAKPSKNSKCACKEHPQVLITRRVDLKANKIPSGMVDQDVRKLLSAEIRKARGSQYSSILGFTKDKVVYESYGEYPSNGGYVTYQRSFSISKDAKVTLGDDVEQVNVLMNIVKANHKPHATATTEDNMALKPNRNGSRARAEETEDDENDDIHTHGNDTPAGGDEDPDDEDNDGEEAPIGDDPGDAGSPRAAARKGSAKGGKGNKGPVKRPAPGKPMGKGGKVKGYQATDDDANDEGDDVDTPARPHTLQSYLEEAPPELRETLESAVRLQASRKNQVIANLKATKRCKFTDEVLKAMSLTELENLAELAAVPTYEGRAMPRVQSSQQDEEDDTPPSPPKVFQTPDEARQSVRNNASANTDEGEDGGFDSSRDSYTPGIERRNNTNRQRAN